MAAPHPPRLIDLIDLLYEGKEIFFRHVRTVADVMQREVRHLTLDHTLGDAWQFLERHRVHHIPVLAELEGDPRRVLVGLVSQRDLARVLSPTVGTLAQTDADHAALQRPLSSVVTRKLRTTAPTASIFDAVTQLVEHKLDCLPVVVGTAKARQLVGLLTTTDVVRCFLRMEVLRRARGTSARATRLIDLVRGQGQQPTELLVEALLGSVQDLMQRDVTTLAHGASLKRALDEMQRLRIRHLPVVDDDGRLVGMLSDRDVIQHLPAPQGQQSASAGARAGFRDELFRIDGSDPASLAALSQKAHEVMTGKPVSVLQDAPLMETAELFCSRGFGAAPVVDAERRVVGIVTQTDFLAALLALGRVVAGVRPAA